MKVTMTDILAPWSVRWPDVQAGPWLVSLTWRWAGDRAECAGFSIIATDEHAEPLSATLVRSVPVMQLVRRARRERYESHGGGLLEAVDDGQDVDISQQFVEHLRREAASWRSRRPGRPVELGREHYAEVARVYSAAHAAGTPPLVAVQDRWHTSRPTASRWVAAARAEGLLPPTDRGRARGNGELIDRKESQA